MQKIYIWKETNSVSQIIKQDYQNYEKYDELTFGDTFYMIEVDDNNHLDCHDYFYNPYTEKFEKVEGITSLDHIASEDEQSETERLKKENEDLKERLKYIEDILNINYKK